MALPLEGSSACKGRGRTQQAQVGELQALTGIQDELRLRRWLSVRTLGGEHMLLLRGGRSVFVNVRWNGVYLQRPEGPQSELGLSEIISTTAGRSNTYVHRHGRRAFTVRRGWRRRQLEV